MDNGHIRTQERIVVSSGVIVESLKRPLGKRT
jgi:hypothetical protein